MVLVEHQSLVGYRKTYEFLLCTYIVYSRDKNYSLELKKSVIICTSNFQSIEEIKKALGDAIFGRFDKDVSTFIEKTRY